MELPPHPGKRTLSPALTLTGTTSPDLLGAPGPTATTVASGRGVDVADVGRKRPVAVFCQGREEVSLVDLAGTEGLMQSRRRGVEVGQLNVLVRA